METLTEKTIGQFVAGNYKTAAVFKKYKIDFCCNGNRTISQACEQQKLNQEKLESDLHTVLTESLQQEETINYKFWPLDLLVDYIEKKHHRYVRAQIPVLNQYLNKLCKVHGPNHPELFEVKELFDGCGTELTSHMEKEEMVLFPAIRKLVDAQSNTEILKNFHFGTVKNPIQMMMHEHDTEGSRFRKISELTNTYTPPADACGTYKVAFALLKEFEEDLHLHIHIENNIIFPKAIKLEAELSN
jgi:regulator of cell morphogenesis and NO signaling